MMTSELPQELLEEILCRVPATALKRLRTTCKLWNHLFNDKKFSRKQFDKAPKQLLGLTLTEESRVCLLNVNLHNGIPSAEVTSELSLNQGYINQVSHCDGLLLCTFVKTTIVEDTRIIVWNPCTGQSEWIQASKNSCSHDFVLGYYQDKKSCDKSYKILDYNSFRHELKLYEINSNSWRNLGVTLDYQWLGSSECSVSLNGKTYWCGLFTKETQLGLISFDYTRERFERLRLPYHQCGIFVRSCLSVVGEDKLSMLLQLRETSREEIWVTTKIDDETKEFSWSKLLEMKDNTGGDPGRDTRFLVDKEKKIFVCCEQHDGISQSVITVYIVGEDSNATPTSIPVKNMCSYRPFLVGYVPSLVQFQPPIGKRKRGE